VKKHLIFVLPTIIILSILLWGCKKDPDLVGLNMQPEGDKLEIGFDTSIYINVYSEYSNHLPSDDYAEMYLGGLYDPIFGKLSSDFYSQLFLSELAPDFGPVNEIITDSVEMRIRLADTYGDSLSPQTITVQRILLDESDSCSQNFNKDSTQYSDWFLPVSSEVFGSHTFVPNAKDSVEINGIKYPALVSFPLTTAFGDLILKSDSEALSEQDKFHKYFNGIRISSSVPSEPNSGQLYAISPTSSYTKIIIYYHNATDTSTYELDIPTDAAYFANYKHYDYADASPELLAQLNEPENITAGKQSAFLQSMTGVRTRVIFPDLSEMANYNGMVLNEAKLVIKNRNQNENVFTTPTQLYLYEQGDKREALQETGSVNYFGGACGDSTDMVWMRITQYVQGLIEGTNDATKKLYMAPAFESSRPGRIEFFGGDPTNNSSSRIQLQLIYTEIE